MFYFYIIEHKETKRLYAGSKTSRDSNPASFMIDYTTSSTVVNQIIDESSSVVFSIRKLILFDDPKKAYGYETKFLEKVNAKNNPRFYNSHNNTLFTHQSEVYKTWLSDNFDVENTFQIPFVKEKIKATNLKRLGVPYPMMADSVKEKSRKTSLQKYGTENPAQSQEIQDKMKATNKERYGTENVFASEHGKTAIRKSMLQKHGVEHPMYSEGIKKKMKETNKRKYGVSNTFCSPIALEKITARRNYLLNRPQLEILREYQRKYKLKFGQGWVRKSDVWIDNLLQETIEKYGEL